MNAENAEMNNLVTDDKRKYLTHSTEEGFWDTRTSIEEFGNNTNDQIIDEEIRCGDQSSAKEPGANTNNPDSNIEGYNDEAKDENHITDNEWSYSSSSKLEPVNEKEMHEKDLGDFFKDQFHHKDLTTKDTNHITNNEQRYLLSQ